jgi:hypothetical protein
MRRLIPFFVILMTVFSACQFGGGATPTGMATSPPFQDAQSSTQSSDQGNNQGGAQVTNTPQNTPTVSNILLPEPQAVTFQASDGQSLSGYYYPAAVNPAPVVVLMHWVGGDMSDWYEIASWLQNRGLENPFPNPGDDPWWDLSWFPAVPTGASYGVFIFSFRGCAPAPAGCASWTPDVWFLDAQAAMQTAAGLEGADATKIVAMGSSVGADGAPDACAWLNEQTPGTCKGALSLSPGNYMDIPYPVAVHGLGQNQPPVAAWCLADEKEFAICEMAEGAGNPVYRDFRIVAGQHGTLLLRPDLEPLPMQIILDFLTETVGP